MENDQAIKTDRRQVLKDMFILGVGFVAGAGLVRNLTRDNAKTQPLSDRKLTSFAENMRTPTTDRSVVVGFDPQHDLFCIKTRETYECDPVHLKGDEIDIFETDPILENTKEK